LHEVLEGGEDFGVELGRDVLQDVWGQGAKEMGGFGENTHAKHEEGCLDSWGRGWAVGGEVAEGFHGCVAGF
jgi:hypothetical protein